MEKLEVLSALQSFEVLSGVPDEDLLWLIDHSELRSFEVGELMFEKGSPVDYMIVLLEGKLHLTLNLNGKNRAMGHFSKGDITGLLPYSRMKEGLGYGKVEEKVLALYTHRDDFREMICDHHDLVQPLVSFMTTRVRNFTALQQQNEKMVALGKLSAGLAHELNNPASAIVRSSEILKQHLTTVPDKFKRVLSIKMTNEQIDAVNDILHNKIACAGKCDLSMMERSALEDEIVDWLDDHGLSDCADVADNFSEFQIDTDDLDKIAELVPEKDLPRC